MGINTFLSINNNKDPVEHLPPELAIAVMQYLPKAQIAKLSCVSHAWNALTKDDYLWQKVAEVQGLPLTWQIGSTYKEKLKTFKAAAEKEICNEIYPDLLRSAFGGCENIFKLPILDMSAKGPREGVTPEMMSGHKIMRSYRLGKGPLVNTPDIFLCLKTPQGELQVEILGTYNGTWIRLENGKDPLMPVVSEFGLLGSLSFDYIGRLIKNEPRAEIFKPTRSRRLPYSWMERVWMIDSELTVSYLTNQREIDNKEDPKPNGVSSLSKLSL